jgi:hypothetical protein
MRTMILMTAVLGLGGACQTPQPKPDPVSLPMPAVATPGTAVTTPVATASEVVPDDGKPVDVSLKVEAVTPRGQTFVDSGETLHTGDKIALHVGVNVPAYVYVALAAADGTQNLIFPRDDSNADGAILKPGGDRRVPAEGQWFRLDKTVGHEDIFVYASKKPLSKDDVLGRVVADNKKPRKAIAGKGGKHPAPKPRPRNNDSGGTGHPTGAVVAANNDAPAASNDDTRGLELVDESTTGPDQVTRRHFSIDHSK